MRTRNRKSAWTVSILLTGICLIWPGHSAGRATENGTGVAATHPGDKGIAKDPDVIVFADFASDKWRSDFSGGTRKTVAVVAEDRGRQFLPWQGSALRIKVPQGQHYGASIQYDFKNRIGREPEAIYFRYYLRFGGDWDPERGGKLPGIGPKTAAALEPWLIFETEQSNR